LKRFFIVFAFLQIVLFIVELTEPVQRWLIIPFTEMLASVSIFFVHLFDKYAVSNGIYLYDMKSGFAMSIEAGCNGVEASIILVSAILAFPKSIKNKLIGLCLGLISLHVLNVIRIISLFYLGQWNETAFDWAHLYIWQALIMLDVFIVFIVWIKYSKEHYRDAA